MNKIRSKISVMPIVTANRTALESKAEKRRKRRESLALNPNDLDALNE